MTEIILESFMALGFGAIIYLIAQALPRIDDSVLETPSRGMGGNRLAIHLEKIDSWLKSFLEKFLRRLRLVILKVDNTLSETLKKLKGPPSKEAVFSSEQKESNGSGDQ